MSSPLLVGVTATAERTDGTPLGDVHDEIVYQMDILDGITQGYLVDLRGIRVQIEADLKRVQTRGGDFVPGELGEALRDANAQSHIVEAWLEHASDRRTLVFTSDVPLAHEVSDEFREHGVPAEALDGTTRCDERGAIIGRLYTGATQVVCNCAVLTEGFDCPAVDCIVMARPTQSRSLYIQCVGRATRPYPGKANALILDLVGNTARHDLQGISTLLGSESARVTDGESLLEAVERHRAELEDEPDRVVEGELVAEVVDLFRRRSLRWVPSGVQQYVLSAGEHGLVAVRATDASLSRWSVQHVTRDRRRTQIAQNLDLGYAQGVAEDFVKRLGAGALVDPKAAWLRKPATEKQLRELWRRGIPASRELTRGEASDLITAASAGAA